MDTGTKVQKAVNQVKTKVENVRGPAKKKESTTPILDAIRAYYDDDSYAFAIPAHKGGRGSDPRVRDLLGDAFRADISMQNGVDNRHQAFQVQATAQDL